MEWFKAKRDQEDIRLSVIIHYIRIMNPVEGKY